jgi:NAD(P)-dependent dehydrogenase (short-subunit alcohol dehydrogenase family)
VTFPGVLTELVADGDERMLVALVAGATRGAGRAIAVELARAGFFVYATGRGSRATGPSEIGRPETIEETGDLIGAAGGAGAARVVDHEDPGQVAALVAAIEDERGRLDVLVNDIFGATGTCSGTSRCGSTTYRAGCGWACIPI